MCASTAGGLEPEPGGGPDQDSGRGRGRGSGEAWRCLRCGTFVPGPPDGSGPAASAPRVRRGKEVRSAVILRVFAIERYLRALVFGAAAFGVWRFSYAHTSVQQAFDHDLPDIRRLYTDLGFDFSHSKLIGLVQHALRLNSHTLDYLALGLAAYAVIEVIEGTGLWLVKRWGEYFAMVATSLFVPYEIYDLSSKVTPLRLGAFLVNLALVLYLVIAKRLFGVRGGKKAYEERLREGSILEQAAEAVARETPAASPDETVAGADETVVRADETVASADETVAGADETLASADETAHEAKTGADETAESTDETSYHAV
jgi:uncharacterized membrane protein (DUF2068 family)